MPGSTEVKVNAAFFGEVGMVVVDSSWLPDLIWFRVTGILGGQASRERSDDR